MAAPELPMEILSGPHSLSQGGLNVTQLTRQNIAVNWQELRRITSEQEGVDTSQTEINSQIFRSLSDVITNLQQHDAAVQEANGTIKKITMARVKAW